MIINKAASIPLITHDPFFSIWSSSDHLYDNDPVHWSGASQKMRGYLIIDDKKYVFLGFRETDYILPQTSIDVTATATQYTFENEDVKFKCRFTSPLVLSDLVLTSRPCTYVDFEVEKKDGSKASNVEVMIKVSSELVKRNRGRVMGFKGVRDDYTYGMMGRVRQTPLSGSDDVVPIDWGYVYLASQEKNAEIWYDDTHSEMYFKTKIEDKASIILAYDELLSINYFGQWRKGYWTNTYATILDAISAAFADKDETLKKAATLDVEIEEKARKIGGESYAYLCNMSYRQAITAHKLISDEEGNVIFLSKENGSNGCIGTVDVSYPSAPLFLLYNTEYVKGMLRPIFKFAACDVWEYDFAPHDVGRYPYAWGQVYAFREARTQEGNWGGGNDGVYPPFYMYPAGSDIYDIRYQMPVEECGNMLVMVAEVCRLDGNVDFARPYWDILKQWKNYLIEFGSDPGDQLCTDDFAGHLEHNVNLSAKAIMGIEGYAMLAEMLGEQEEAKKHHALAREMAADWEKRALAGDHYVLAFGSPETWSLKYNLVWDKLWNCHLFSDEVYEKELAYYEKQLNKYGIPLDSRRAYTKSDWILWCVAMDSDRERAQKLIAPIADYLENAPERVPFGDWYDTETGVYYYFKARSVQGGIFMPMLRDEK